MHVSTLGYTVGLNYTLSVHANVLRVCNVFGRSWIQIFDIDLECEDWRGDPSQQSVQAMFWRLELDQVKAAVPFVAR